MSARWYVHGDPSNICQKLSAKTTIVILMVARGKVRDSQRRREGAIYGPEVFGHIWFSGSELH